jgi:hypothetical protein
MCCLVLLDIQVSDGSGLHWIYGALVLDQQHLRWRSCEAGCCCCFYQWTVADRKYHRIVSDPLMNSSPVTNCKYASHRYAWPSNWGPTYRYSYAVCIAALGVSTGMFGMMHIYLKRLNERMERMELDAKDNEGLQDPVGFRYLV